MPEDEISESATSSDTEVEPEIKDTNEITTNEPTTNDNSDETTVKTVTIKQGAPEEPNLQTQMETSYEKLNGTYEIEADTSLSTDNDAISENSYSDAEPAESMKESEPESDSIEPAEPADLNGFVVRFDSTVESSQLSVIKEESSIGESTEQTTSHHTSMASITDDKSLTHLEDFTEHYKDEDHEIIQVMKGWNVMSGAEPADGVSDDDLMDFIPWLEVKHEMENMEELEQPQKEDMTRFMIVEDPIEPEHMFNIDCGVASGDDDNAIELFEPFAYPVLEDEDLRLHKIPPRLQAMELEIPVVAAPSKLESEMSGFSSGEEDASSIVDDNETKQNEDNISQKPDKKSLSKESDESFDVPSLDDVLRAHSRSELYDPQAMKTGQLEQSTKDNTSSQEVSETKSEPTEQKREEVENSTLEESALTAGFDEEKTDQVIPVVFPGAQIENEPDQVHRKEESLLKTEEQNLEVPPNEISADDVYDELQSSKMSEKSSSDEQSFKDQVQRPLVNNQETLESQNTTNEQPDDSESGSDLIQPKVDTINQTEESRNTTAVTETSDSDSSGQLIKAEEPNQTTESESTKEKSSKVENADTTAETSGELRNDIPERETSVDQSNEVVGENVLVESELQPVESEKPNLLVASEMVYDKPQVELQKDNESEDEESDESKSDQQEIKVSASDVLPTHERVTDARSTNEDSQENETTISESEKAGENSEASSKKSSTSSSDFENLSSDAKDELVQKKQEEAEIKLDELNPMAKLESRNGFEVGGGLDNLPQTDDLLEIQSGSSSMLHGKEKEELNESASDFVPELEAFISSPIDKRVFVLEAPENAKTENQNESTASTVEASSKTDLKPKVIDPTTDGQSESQDESDVKDETLKEGEKRSKKSTTMEESELFETASESEDLSTVSDNSNLVSFHGDDQIEKFEPVQVQETNDFTLEQVPVMSDIGLYQTEDVASNKDDSFHPVEKSAFKDMSSSSETAKEPTEGEIEASIDKSVASEKSTEESKVEQETHHVEEKSKANESSANDQDVEDTEASKDAESSTTSDQDSSYSEAVERPEVLTPQVGQQKDGVSQGEMNSTQVSESSENLESSSATESEKIEPTLSKDKISSVADSSFDPEDKVEIAAAEKPIDATDETKTLDSSALNQRSELHDSSMEESRNVTKDKDSSFEGSESKPGGINEDTTGVDETSNKIDSSVVDDAQTVETKVVEVEIVDVTVDSRKDESSESLEEALDKQGSQTLSENDTSKEAESSAAELETKPEVEVLTTQNESINQTSDLSKNDISNKSKDSDLDESKDVEENARETSRLDSDITVEETSDRDQPENKKTIEATSTQLDSSVSSNSETGEYKVASQKDDSSDSNDDESEKEAASASEQLAANVSLEVKSNEENAQISIDEAEDLIQPESEPELHEYEGILEAGSKKFADTSINADVTEEENMQVPSYDINVQNQMEEIQEKSDHLQTRHESDDESVLSDKNSSTSSNANEEKNVVSLEQELLKAGFVTQTSRNDSAMSPENDNDSNANEKDLLEEALDDDKAEYDVLVVDVVKSESHDNQLESGVLNAGLELEVVDKEIDIMIPKDVSLTEDDAKLSEDIAHLSTNDKNLSGSEEKESEKSHDESGKSLQSPDVSKSNVSEAIDESQDNKTEDESSKSDDVNQLNKLQAEPVSKSANTTIETESAVDKESDLDVSMEISRNVGPGENPLAQLNEPLEGPSAVSERKESFGSFDESKRDQKSEASEQAPVIKRAESSFSDTESESEGNSEAEKEENVNRSHSSVEQSEEPVEEAIVAENDIKDDLMEVPGATVDAEMNKSENESTVSDADEGKNEVSSILIAAIDEENAPSDRSDESSRSDNEEEEPEKPTVPFVEEMRAPPQGSKEEADSSFEASKNEEEKEGEEEEMNESDSSDNSKNEEKYEVTPSKSQIPDFNVDHFLLVSKVDTDQVTTSQHPSLDDITKKGEDQIIIPEYFVDVFAENAEEQDDWEIVQEDLGSPDPKLIIPAKDYLKGVCDNTPEEEISAIHFDNDVDESFPFTYDKLAEVEAPSRNESLDEKAQVGEKAETLDSSASKKQDEAAIKVDDDDSENLSTYTESSTTAESSANVSGANLLEEEIRKNGESNLQAAPVDSDVRTSEMKQDVDELQGKTYEEIHQVEREEKEGESVDDVEIDNNVEKEEASPAIYQVEKETPSDDSDKSLSREDSAEEELPPVEKQEVKDDSDDEEEKGEKEKVDVEASKESLVEISSKDSDEEEDQDAENEESEDDRKDDRGEKEFQLPDSESETEPIVDQSDISEKIDVEKDISKDSVATVGSDHSGPAAIDNVELSATLKSPENYAKIPQEKENSDSESDNSDTETSKSDSQEKEATQNVTDVSSKQSTANETRELIEEMGDLEDPLQTELVNEIEDKPPNDIYGMDSKENNASNDDLSQGVEALKSEEKVDLIPHQTGEDRTPQVVESESENEFTEKAAVDNAVGKPGKEMSTHDNEDEDVKTSTAREIENFVEDTKHDSGSESSSASDEESKNVEEKEDYETNVSKDEDAQQENDAETSEIQRDFDRNRSDISFGKAEVEKQISKDSLESSSVESDSRNESEPDDNEDEKPANVNQLNEESSVEEATQQIGKEKEEEERKEESDEEEKEEEEEEEEEEEKELDEEEEEEEEEEGKGQDKKEEDYEKMKPSEQKPSESSSSESSEEDEKFIVTQSTPNIPDFDVDLFLTDPKSVSGKSQAASSIAYDVKKSDKEQLIIPEFFVDVFAENAEEQDDWVIVQENLGSPDPGLIIPAKDWSKQGHEDNAGDKISAIQFEEDVDNSFPFSYDKLAELGKLSPRPSIIEKAVEEEEPNNLDTSVSKKESKAASEIDHDDLENLSTYSEDTSEAASSKNISGANLLEDEIENVENPNRLQAAFSPVYNRSLFDPEIDESGTISVKPPGINKPQLPTEYAEIHPESKVEAEMLSNSMRLFEVSPTNDTALPLEIPLDNYVHEKSEKRKASSHSETLSDDESVPTERNEVPPMSETIRCFMEAKGFHGTLESDSNIEPDDSLVEENTSNDRNNIEGKDDTQVSKDSLESNSNESDADSVEIVKQSEVVLRSDHSDSQSDEKTKDRRSSDSNESQSQDSDSEKQNEDLNQETAIQAPQPENVNEVDNASGESDDFEKPPIDFYESENNFNTENESGFSMPSKTKHFQPKSSANVKPWEYHFSSKGSHDTEEPPESKSDIPQKSGTDELSTAKIEEQLSNLEKLAMYPQPLTAPAEFEDEANNDKDVEEELKDSVVDDIPINAESPVHQTLESAPAFLRTSSQEKSSTEVENGVIDSESKIVEDILSTNNDWTQPLELAPDFLPTTTSQEKPEMTLFDWRNFDLPVPSTNPDLDFNFKTPDKESPSFATGMTLDMPSERIPEKPNSVLNLVDQFEKEISDQQVSKHPTLRPVVKKKPTFLPMEPTSQDDVVSMEDNELSQNLMSTPQFDPESLPQLPNVYEIAEKVMNKSKANETEHRPLRQSQLFTVSHSYTHKNFLNVWLKIQASLDN